MTTVSLDPPLLDLYAKSEASTRLEVSSFDALGKQRANIYRLISALSDVTAVDVLLARLWQELEEYFPLTTLNDRLKDHHAHFIMRLVCGSSPDLMSMFTRCEVLILNARMRKWSVEWQQQFVEKWVSEGRRVGLFPPAEVVLHTSNQTSLRVSRTKRDNKSEDCSGMPMVPCWIVPLEECVNLIARRRVCVQKGNAIVPVNKSFFSYTSETTSLTKIENKKNKRYSCWTDPGTNAFSLLLEKFSRFLKHVIEVSSRARSLFDSNASSVPLNTVISRLEKQLRLPYTGQIHKPLGRYPHVVNISRASSSSGSTVNICGTNNANGLSSSDARNSDGISAALNEHKRLKIDLELIRNPQLWRCFPPCMFRLVDHLDLTHHLKFDGRVQFMVFLRSIGLPLQDAIMFLRQEFARDDTMTQKRYNSKRYEYFIRHIYGREGRGVPWATHKCDRIQAKSPQYSQVWQQAPLRGEVQGTACQSSCNPSDGLSILRNDSNSDHRKLRQQLGQRPAHGCPFVNCRTTSAMSNLVQAQLGGVYRRKQYNDQDNEDPEDSDSDDENASVIQYRTNNSKRTKDEPIASKNITKLLQIARRSPNLACQFHFALNLDLVDSLSDIEDLTTISDAGVGRTPAAYFHAATALLRRRQQQDAAKMDLTESSLRKRGEHIQT